MNLKLKLAYSINLIALLVVSLSLPSQAGEEKVGTSSASFLKIGIGARAPAMGDAACALSEDSTAIYWNPAGLGFLKSNELSYMHNLWFQEITHGFLGYAHPLKNFILGFGIDYLTMGEIEETTILQPRGTGDKVRVEDDLACFLSLARRMNNGLSLGMNLKYINQKVADESATGLGADLGLLYKLPRLNLGLAIQNIGTSMKFAEKEFSLPFNIKTGVAYKGIKNATIALDVNLSSDNKTSYHLGGEYWIGNILALRAGYNSRISGNRLGKFSLGEGINVGFGVNFKVAQFDAAYVSYGDLGGTYRVSLLTRFGKTEDRGQKTEDKRQKALDR